MHGLVNRGIQGFVTERYGQATWNGVLSLAGLDMIEFHLFQSADIKLTHALLDASAEATGLQLGDLCCDLGTWLVTSPKTEAVRRLLRFGGATYPAFLASLDVLPGRVALTIPDFSLPALDIRDHQGGQYSISLRSELPLFGQILAGLLRAMADDYGCLALVTFLGRHDKVENLSVVVLDTEFAPPPRQGESAGVLS